MIDFKIEEQSKKVEKLVEQSIQATEFWFNAVLSSVKAFYKIK
jgi:hypothetical protein